MSKFVRICKKCGDDAARLKFVIRLTYLRLKTGRLRLDIGKTDFDKKFLTVAIEFYDICTAIPPQYAGQIDNEKDVEWVKLGCQDPFFLHNKLNDPKERSTMAAMKQSSKRLIKWIHAAAQGSYDSTFDEMSTNCRRQKPSQKLTYAKLNTLTDVVNELLGKEAAAVKQEQALQAA